MKLQDRISQLLASTRYSQPSPAILVESVFQSYLACGKPIKALESAIAACPSYKWLNPILARWKMGDFSYDKEGMTDELGELLGIITVGASSGARIKTALENLCANLALSSELDRKIKGKVNGMQTISMAGLVFFFPIFGGITATIMQSTISGQQSVTISHYMVLAGIGYVLLMLLLNTLMTKPDKSRASLARSVIPPFLFSMALELLTYHLASYAI
ncbi:MAG: hypothetical protein KGH61_03255 [Candidatus Micrarchaeota archaeon]|nr:hypothetical protein [Candidatus Micrarchaeota archaeon]MDE1847941.1 hypothetical protein [Candidatus Micrarchaeota archaeon]MDE1864342.1 hypothetical protein [Candidatus Micrarchaeota archaeon]